VLKSIYKDLSNVGKKSSAAKAVMEMETRHETSVACDSAHCSDSDISCSNTFQCLQLADEVEVAGETGRKEKRLAADESRIRRQSEQQQEQEQCMIEDDSLERLMCLHVYRAVSRSRDT
jgi:hypothetical protein